MPCFPLDAAMPYEPPPNIQSLDLDALAALISGQSRPPVEAWHPEASSDSHMRIAKDGRWYHRGDEIKRPAMVRLFASILRREDDGRYALLTPYERQFITVEEAPFLAVELSVSQADSQLGLGFRLNTDELVIAGTDQPLRLAGTAQDPRFLLSIRPGLEAALCRTVHYDLVNVILDLAVEDEAGFTLNYGGTVLQLPLPVSEGAA